MTRRSSRSSIGENVNDLRTARGWSLAELAERAGTTKGYLSMVERGMCEPGARVLGGLADAFEVSVDSLMGRTA